MAINTTSATPDAHHFYPVSADNTLYEGKADAGEFFSTLLDIINPLQHIPLVSTLYRELTGDEINPAARMVGGAVFGGPIGFATASANVLLQQASGADAMGHALSLFSDDTPDPLEQVAPALQAARPVAPKPEPLLQQASAAPASPEPEAIAWPGPQAIPALTENVNSEILQYIKEKSSTEENPVVSAAAAQTKTPVWLEKSRDAAQRDETARANGSLTQTRTAQPWVANAMFDALDKYEALARARTEKADSDTGS